MENELEKILTTTDNHGALALIVSFGSTLNEKDNPDTKAASDVEKAKACFYTQP